MGKTKKQQNHALNGAQLEQDLRFLLLCVWNTVNEETLGIFPYHVGSSNKKIWKVLFTPIVLFHDPEHFLRAKTTIDSQTKFMLYK